MGMHDFAISTNHPFNKYNSGQTVRGRVHFKLDEPKRVRGVYVKLKGLAEVKWTESKTTRVHGKSKTHRITYYGEHEYFNDRIYLIGKQNGDSFQLSAGDHSYKFQYDLPIGLPSSYESPIGTIRYTITAVLDIPFGFDHEEQVGLQVMSPIDLNRMPELRNPGHIVNSKHLCCLFCRSGPLTMEINIPKTGYAHGENIYIRGDIENLSNSEITAVECTLKRKLTFHSIYPSHRTKHHKETLCSIQIEGVPMRSARTYEKTLKIPEDIVLNFDNCDLFDVKYTLKVEACIRGCHLNLSSKIPITMGSVPLLSDHSWIYPISPLAGLGTPYPYETDRQNF